MPSCLSLGCFRPSKRTLPFPGPPSACRLQNRLGVTPNADVWLNNHFIAIEFTCRAVHPFQGLSVCPQSCVAATTACSRAHASPQNEVPRPSLPIPPRAPASGSHGPSCLYARLLRASRYRWRRTVCVFRGLASRTVLILRRNI